jgi:hypothetical protein
MDFDLYVSKAAVQRAQFQELFRRGNMHKNAYTDACVQDVPAHQWISRRTYCLLDSIIASHLHTCMVVCARVYDSSMKRARKKEQERERSSVFVVALGHIP